MAIQKRIETKYCDIWFENIDDAIDRALEAKQNGEAFQLRYSQCCLFIRKLIERNIVPDTLTDQTSAHDPLIGYIPHTINNTQASIMRQEDPEQYLELAYASMKRHVELMMELQARGAITFDYGNNIRARANEYQTRNKEEESRIGQSEIGTTVYVPMSIVLLSPGFVPAYIRPLFCEGKGPFRWAALSG
jgi:urocanate hydratase